MEQSPVDQFNQTSGGTRKWFGIVLLFLSALGLTTIILTAKFPKEERFGGELKKKTIDCLNQIIT